MTTDNYIEDVYLVRINSYFLTYDIFIEESELGYQTTISYETSGSGSRLFSTLEENEAKELAERFSGVVVTR